jgi:hypothetical protein
MIKSTFFIYVGIVLGILLRNTFPVTLTLPILFLLLLVTIVALLRLKRNGSHAV